MAVYSRARGKEDHRSKLMRFVVVTILLFVGCSPPPPALAAGNIVSLSCKWNVEQIKWSHSGEVMDKETFVEASDFLLDKSDMTAATVSLAATHRTYKMTMDDQFINLKYNDDHDYIEYSFDRLSLSMSEHRTIFFPQGRITIAGAGGCSAQP
jgi:hypothetical protein